MSVPACGKPLGPHAASLRRAPWGPVSPAGCLLVALLQPGAGAYNVPGSIGAKHDPAASVRITTLNPILGCLWVCCLHAASRMDHKPAVKRSREPLAAPCPPQAASTLRNSPTVRFGTSTRDQDAKVFISQEHEKGAYGTCRCAGSGATASPAGRGGGHSRNGRVQVRG